MTLSNFQKSHTDIIEKANIFVCEVLLMSTVKVFKAIIMGVFIYIVCMFPLMFIAYQMDRQHAQQIYLLCEKNKPLICYMASKQYVGKFPIIVEQPVLIRNCSIVNNMIYDRDTGLLFEPCQCETANEGVRK